MMRRIRYPAVPEALAPVAGVAADPWDDLRRYTSARLALGRSGASMPTAELLSFGLAHAQARDAVHAALQVPELDARLRGLGLETLQVRSAAPDRAGYLLRPDLGRRLSPESAALLREHAVDRQECDLLLVIGDGLSSLAVDRNAAPLVEQILAQAPPDWRIGPAVIATQARVALADEVGGLLRARLVAMLIGERPGLSSPDSLGVYLTWAPRPGCCDADRNCISNVRDGGQDPAGAAHRLWWLAREARRIGASGVNLKDRSDELLLPGSS